MRVGIGYDVHPLAEGRKLVLGGTDIPHTRGLAGHSDGDALLHSIGDALLGGAGKEDIGNLFPDTDPRYQGISSMILLAKIKRKLLERGFKIHNVDAVIVAEEPKMSSYIPQMKKNIAQVLGIEPERVGVKATTSEGLGFLGKKKGIACWSVASLEKKEEP
ncbi:2-C-methyl-D-erythritol 2,4-cyclodiphosphate synthase [subsurface metagenome]